MRSIPWIDRQLTLFRQDYSYSLPSGIKNTMSIATCNFLLKNRSVHLSLGKEIIGLGMRLDVRIVILGRHFKPIASFTGSTQQW